MSHLNKMYFLLLLACFMLSCHKITDVKPDSRMRTPDTLDDCQALLDDNLAMNGYENGGYPSMPVISADEYYVTNAMYNTYSLVNRQAMIWASRIMTGSTCPDWDLPYNTVATVNTVFEALRKIGRGSDPAKWDLINRRAHFYRAFAFYQLAQVFAPAYDSNSAAADLGIPLPMSTDLNQAITRASVQQTYDQILSDLQQAMGLPATDNDWRPTRPSPAAVYAMCARVYLSARNYTQALHYADSSLQLQSALMRYDTIDKSKPLPFSRWNPEVIFCAAYYRSGPARLGGSFVDSLLIRSYDSNDQRKTLFFSPEGNFRGTYDEGGLCFAGLAVDEMFLTRCECLARTGSINEAMTGLNHLLETRWAASTFTPYSATDTDDALEKILQERKKELVFRGTRWTDLRRLNKDAKTAHSISRTVNGILYSLPPNSDRWVLPIPDNVISFNPGMPQNDR